MGRKCNFQGVAAQLFCDWMGRKRCFQRVVAQNISWLYGTQTSFSGGCGPKHADTRRHFPKQPSISYYPTKKPSVITTEGYITLAYLYLSLSGNFSLPFRGSMYFLVSSAIILLNIMRENRFGMHITPLQKSAASHST